MSDSKELLSATFPIVGVGASAGGLEAFSELVKNLPGDFGGSVVLVTHLSPTHPSNLVPILSRVAKLPVIEIMHGQALQRGQIYIIPANAEVTLGHQAFVLEPRSETGGPHLPIDILFNSLAHDQESPVVGVVLSGTGVDGSFGLQAIRAAGGIAFAQDPVTARFSEMPAHAASLGVDYLRFCSLGH